MEGARITDDIRWSPVPDPQREAYLGILRRYLRVQRKWRLVLLAAAVLLGLLVTRAGYHAAAIVERAYSPAWEDAADPLNAEAADQAAIDAHNREAFQSALGAGCVLGIAVFFLGGLPSFFHHHCYAVLSNAQPMLRAEGVCAGKTPGLTGLSGNLDVVLPDGNLVRHLVVYPQIYERIAPGDTVLLLSAPGNPDPLAALTHSGPSSPAALSSDAA